MSNITLNFWIMPNAGFETRQAMAREIALFKKAHRGLEVRLTIHPWYYAWDRLISVIKKKEWDNIPDVIQIGSTWTTTLAALGALFDMTDYLAEIDRQDIIRPAWNYCYDPARTKAYSLPWFMDVRVLYFRRDLLDTIGREPSDLDTWDGFLQTCQRLRRHPALSRRYFALPLSGQKEGILIHDLAPWVWGAGGDFLTPDRRHAILHESAALRGAHFYFQMITDRIIPLLGRDRITAGNFFTGHFAFQVSGAWPLESTLNPKHPHYQPDVAKSYGVALFPGGPAGQVTFLGGSNLAITTFSRQPEAAWKWVQFLTSPEVQVRHARAIGMLPSRYSALETYFHHADAQVAEVFRQSLRTAKTLPSALTLGTLERIVGETTHRILQAIREERYSGAFLERELRAAAEETDYILSLYE